MVLRHAPHLSIGDEYVFVMLGAGVSERWCDKEFGGVQNRRQDAEYQACLTRAWPNNKRGAHFRFAGLYFKNNQAASQWTIDCYAHSGSVTADGRYLVRDGP